MWVVGDDFIRNTFGVIQDVYEKSLTNLEVPRPYIFQYYNVYPFTKLAAAGKEGDSVMACVLNVLQEAVNTRPRLPRFLIVALDNDLINEFEQFSEEELNPRKDFYRALEYLAQQVNLTIKRRRMLIEKAIPGAVYSEHPTVIFIKSL